MKRSVFTSSFAVAALLLASCDKKPEPKAEPSGPPPISVNFNNDATNKADISITGVTVAGEPQDPPRGTFGPGAKSHALDLPPIGPTETYQVTYSIDPADGETPCVYRKDKCDFPPVTFTTADVEKNGGIITITVPKDSQ